MPAADASLPASDPPSPAVGHRGHPVPQQHTGHQHSGGGGGARRGFVFAFAVLTALVIMLSVGADMVAPSSSAAANQHPHHVDAAAAAAAAALPGTAPHAAVIRQPLPEDPVEMLQLPEGKRKEDAVSLGAGARGVGHYDNGGEPLPLRSVPPGSDAEIRQRYWQSQRMCIFALVGEKHEQVVFEEASVAMRAWGDHRTFLTTFAPGLLKAAKEVHSLMARAAAGNASLLREPEEWVAAATALAAKQGGRLPLHSPVPPTMLLVPPSVPPPGTEGGNTWTTSKSEPRATRIARVIKAAAEQQRRAMEGRPWTLRAAEDAVILLDTNSVDVLEMKRMEEITHTWARQLHDQWLSKEGKSLLTWDYITRMLRWRGRADGAEAGGPGGFSECEWVMKADTDTVVNRAALRQGELLLAHGNPRTNPVYAGFPMQFGRGGDFMFGGLGYYFSRAALEVVRTHPVVNFRSCLHYARLVEPESALMSIVEDGLMGLCMTTMERRFDITDIKRVPLMGRHLSIGNRTSMVVSYLARRHHCTCCMSTMHKAGPDGQRLAYRIVRDNCITSPQPALSRELGTLQGYVADLCSSELVVTDQYCKWRGVGDEPTTFKAMGVDDDRVFSEPKDLQRAMLDVDGPTYPL